MAERDAPKPVHKIIKPPEVGPDGFIKRRPENGYPPNTFSAVFEGLRAGRISVQEIIEEHLKSRETTSTRRIKS